MRKITSIVLMIAILSGIFPSQGFTLATEVSGAGSYPGKMNIKNVNGLGKNLSTDFFAGAMTFRYPLVFPSGSRGMTPGLELSYASNNTDAFSPYGYGFSLSLGRIQRSAKKGVSELYVGDEFSAFGNDLIKELGSATGYRSKDGNDLNLYEGYQLGWTVSTLEGRQLTYGKTDSSRISDPADPNRVYAWLIEKEQDQFGNKIEYIYTKQGAQPFLSEIRYGYDATGANPLYSLKFEYISKGASLTSYKTQFEVKTEKLLSRVSLYVDTAKVRSYEFLYDNTDTPISHLQSITEKAGDSILPSISFRYGDAQYQHQITEINNNRGGVARFEYAPSTGYRDTEGGLLNSKLPFSINTLSNQTLIDQVTGIVSEEKYSYQGGHYYFDSSDIWGREYVGFATVAITDDKTKKVLSFHQSQTSDPSPLKYQDHIAKKGRVYQTDIYDKAINKLLSREYVRYDMKQLFGERRLVFPLYKFASLFADDASHMDTAVAYQYDDDGNITEEKNLGWVTANLENGTYTDIVGDTVRKETTYTKNPLKNLARFVTRERVYGFSGGLASSTRVEYDDTLSGVVMGLVTAKIIESTDGTSDIREKMRYSPRGLLIEKEDPYGNISSSLYDTRAIALTESTNPLGWKTTYQYDYAIGKPRQTTNQNNIVNTIGYDVWGREKSIKINSDGTDRLISETVYDDASIPNRSKQTVYFDYDALDKKTTTNYTDGWGRVISTSISTEKPNQYSATQIRYDDDGNPVYGGYPVFTVGDGYDVSLVLSGVTDGELYRARSPGMSFAYDALDRIVRQRDAKGTSTKRYTPNSETYTNALGVETSTEKSAYGDITKLTEKISGRTIVTQYVYDNPGRIVAMRHTDPNIRNWYYDSYGRLSSVTDMHKEGDTTFGVRSYTYDLLGRIKNYTNANSETISYVYDPLSRLVTESVGTGTARTFTYDEGSRSLGTLSRVEDGGSTVSYLYDPLGRKVTETRTVSGVPYTLSYTYNLQNALTSIIYPDLGKAEYRYKNGYIEGVSYTDPLGIKTGLISDISYAPNSTMKSIRYGNGAIKNTERDSENNYRLSRSLVTAADGTKILDTEYRYDAINNTDRITESGIDPLKKSIDYSYDALSRLTGASYAYGVTGYGRGQNENFTYTYDDIGNITYASSVGAYNYDGESTYANPYAVTQAGDTTYAYDQAGHTTSRSVSGSTLAFTYSPYGEMLSSTRDGLRTDYVYDHTRRRIVKSSSGLVEHHIIDGYEVEYESGALIYVPEVLTQTGTTASGATTESGVTITSSGGTSDPLVSTGSTDGSGTTSSPTSTGSTEPPISATGTTSSGTSMESGSLSEGTQSGTTSSESSGSTLSGSTSTGSSLPESTSSGTTSVPDSASTPPVTSTGSTETGTVIVSSTTSGSTDTGTYIVVTGLYSGYETGVVAPVTVKTSLTHIMLGDERIATFQSQTDDTPRTSDDDRLVYHLSDHLNSASVDLSSTGVLLQAVDYLPFGKTLTYEVTTTRIKGKKGGYKNKYLFANKQLDEETDLQYFEKRYYDSRIGKFTTEDPVAWEVGLTKRPSQYFTDPEQWNTYSYVRNNPINLVDPTGELVDYSRTYTDALTGHPYYRATNFTVFDGDVHYIGDMRTAIQVSFTEIDTNFLTPKSFNSINEMTSSWGPGSYTIKGDTAKQSFTTRTLDDYILYGDLTFITEGKLIINQDRSWSYNGTLKTYDDIYDFTVTINDWLDPSRFGRNIETKLLNRVKYENKGTPFDVQIRGEKALKGSGPALSPEKHKTGQGSIDNKEAASPKVRTRTR